MLNYALLLPFEHILIQNAQSLLPGLTVFCSRYSGNEGVGS
jgi:hypothetical protein